MGMKIALIGIFLLFSLLVFYPNESNAAQTDVAKIYGTLYAVPFSIDNGVVLDVWHDRSANSLTFEVDTVHDSTLSAYIQRSLLDAKIGTQDDSFFVLVDGVEVNANEVVSDNIVRTLEIQVPYDSRIVEIIGTEIFKNQGIPRDIRIPYGTSALGCEDDGWCYNPLMAIGEVGTSITWFNDDSETHTVTSHDGSSMTPDGLFDSGLIAPGDSFSVSLYSEDLFYYFCKVHPWMKGMILITAPVAADVSLNQDNYYLGETIYGEIEAPNANQDTNYRESVNLIFFDTLDPNKREILTVDESSVNSGIFPFSFPNPLKSGDPDIEMGFLYDYFAAGVSSYAEDFAHLYGNPPLLTDSDGDGIPDVLDQCPTQPETYNGFQDADGCPDTIPKGTPSVLQTDKSGYIIGSDVIITLTDPDLNTTFAIDSINANNIHVYYQGEQTTIVDPVFNISHHSLQETGKITGIFQVMIEVPSRIGSTVLQDGDWIELRFVDNSPSGGGASTAAGFTVLVLPVIPPPHPPPPNTDVVINLGTNTPGCENNNSCYSPFNYNVKQGETVAWYNADTDAHTVTSGYPFSGPDGKFDSSLIMSGDSFFHTFNQAGTFHYFDMTHPWMEGNVIVKQTSVSGNPPKILQKPDIDSFQNIINFSVKAIDDPDGDVSNKVVCNPKSGTTFPPGTTTVTCSVTDSDGNTGTMSFKVTISSTGIIPQWVKLTVEWYCSNQVTESEFKDALVYLVQTNVINVSATSSGSGSAQPIPSWVKTSICYWPQGVTTENEFIDAVEYLINQGIIVV